MKRGLSTRKQAEVEDVPGSKQEEFYALSNELRFSSPLSMGM